jgi:polyhydroxyalkanoate synthesis regulator phasin
MTKKKGGPPKQEPADWASRQGTTSAGHDNITTDERIIFLRDDLMQFINSQLGQLAKTVQVSARQTQDLTRAIETFRTSVDKATAARLDSLTNHVQYLQDLIGRRWYKRAWTYVRFKVWRTVR